MSGIQGGDIFSGFASGAIGSLAASFYSGGTSENALTGESFHVKGLNDAIGGGNFGMIAFGTVSGGAGAALTGGNFWQGAATALVVGTVNHAMHGGFSKKYKLHVLQDRQGANKAGHQALAGEIDGKLLYVSQDGTNENMGVFGKSNHTIREFDSFEEIYNYYTTKTSPGKQYDLKLTYKVTAAQLKTALTTAIRLVKLDYNLFYNSCTTVVQISLMNAGIISNSKTYMIPFISYSKMKKGSYSPAY